MTVRKIKDRKTRVSAESGPSQMPEQVMPGTLTLVLPGAPVINVQFDPRPMMRRLVEGQARAQQLGAEVIVTLVEPIDVRIGPPPKPAAEPAATPDLGGPDA